MGRRRPPMSKPEVSKKKMLSSLQEWRDRLIEDNRASESTDFWNEEENRDQTMYLAIRALIENGPEVDEEFVERWRRKLQQQYGSLAGFEYADIEEMLREAG